MEPFNYRNSNDNENIEQQNYVSGLGVSPTNESEQKKFAKEQAEKGLKKKLIGNLCIYMFKEDVQNISSIINEINDDDFDIEMKNNVPVIYSKSTYFSSLLGLNGPDEKSKCLNRKINRNIYDEFDKKIKDLTEGKAKIKQFCKENGININIIGANGGCVYGDYVCIKYTPYVQYEKKKDWIEPTIKHESQHVKFNKFCEENGIKKNGYLKILDEVIAHCMNTKDKNGNTDFDEIEKSMINNENYRKNSGFIEDYGWILIEIIQDVKNNIKDGLDETMKMLINKYKD